MSQMHHPRGNKRYSKKKGRIGGVIFGSIFAFAGIAASSGVLNINDPELSFPMQLLMAAFFLLTFTGVGCTFIWLSLKKTDTRKKLQAMMEEGIASDQKGRYKVFYTVAAIFMIPAVLIAVAGIAEWKAFGFSSLIFFIIALVIFLFGQKSKNTYLAIGPTRLMSDPGLAVIGGELGGYFELQAKPRNELKLLLNCVHTYSSGSGDNRSTHTDILFQKDTVAYIDTDVTGRRKVKFLFDIPVDKPESDSDEYRGTISWELKASGTVTTDRKVPGTQIAEVMEFSRSWSVPVVTQAEATAMGIREIHSQIDIPRAHSEKIERVSRAEAHESAERQIDMTTASSGETTITSESGRNAGMWGMLLVFGAIFGAVGIFLFYLALNENGTLWLMAPIFTLVGFAIFFFAIFLAGRKLEATIINGRVNIIRSLFGKPLYQRSGVIRSPSQLSLETTMSSTSQDRVKTEYMAIYAQLDGKKIKLAEGIEGRNAGEAMMDKIKSALTTELDSELG